MSDPRLKEQSTAGTHGHPQPQQSRGRQPLRPPGAGCLYPSALLKAEVTSVRPHQQREDRRDAELRHEVVSWAAPWKLPGRSSGHAFPKLRQNSVEPCDLGFSLASPACQGGHLLRVPCTLHSSWIPHGARKMVLSALTDSAGVGAARVGSQPLPERMRIL
ncbi:hypothetical protein TREES_T100014937 [Tupaia chinensis]|uniref:Uncharacterized protein n=1 Tax=Tupaia chinensis TaxID=246437 RepID=L9KP86_TUPCH|nr:hypothetical protein TREES_T100014937 [Tupaia chinensis]